jgi:thioredoxin 1
LTVYETSDSKQIADAIDTDGVVVVDFGAESWCVPCQRLRPVYDAVSEKVTATLVRADIEDNPELVAEYGIQSVPTVLAYKDGSLVGSVTARTAVALVSEINNI